MTVNISKQLLGMACIIAGAFIPLILCTLNWLPSRVRPPGGRRVHPPNHPAAADGHGHHRAGEPSGSRRKPAAWEKPAWSNCPGTPPPC